MSTGIPYGGAAQRWHDNPLQEEVDSLLVSLGRQVWENKRMQEEVDRLKRDNARMEYHLSNPSMTWRGNCGHLWVPQEDSRGCCVACIAMVTGKTYQEVKAWFEMDFNDRGTSQHGIEEYLVEHGYTWARKTLYRHNNQQRTPWPPEPFADVHICEVAGTSSHAVVLLRDGTVLDPLTPEPKRLTDYEKVYYVAAITRLDKEAQNQP
jgi:hypothetical protein